MLPTDTLPKLTVQELALAERVAQFLAPTLLQAMATRASKPAAAEGAATAAFCRAYRIALRDGGHTRLLRLAAAFVESQPKE